MNKRHNAYESMQRYHDAVRRLQTLCLVAAIFALLYFTEPLWRHLL